MILDKSLTSKSGRIMLVPPSEADDGHMAALRSHPETRRYISFFPEHFTPEEARARRLDRQPNKELVDFSVYDITASPPKFVGSTGIFKIDEAFKACESGITICPDLFRGGYATEALHGVLTHAFEERKIHRVSFQTSTDNSRMRGWFERFGITLEGTLRDGWADGSGGYTNVCLYSVLEQEWAQTVKVKMEEQINRAAGSSGASAP
ncbi:acyl-CoA N-acyltransferase [Mycena crocata]|nr:acyl-CoA N-acyltransferase [Mycena crocata]